MHSDLFPSVKREQASSPDPALREDLTLCYCDRDEDLAPGARYGPVIRNAFVLECCTGGFGSAIVNGREFPVKAGDCYVLLPGDTVIHTASFEEPRRGLFCCIDGMCLWDLFRKAGIRSDQPYLPKECFEGIRRELERMLPLSKEARDGGSPLRRSAAVMALVGEALRFTPPTEDRSLSVAAALRLMEARYDQALSVTELAQEAGLERCWFSTVFKAETGLSPHEYLTRLRIKKACELLTQTDCSVGLAAASVGIAPENFARSFKKVMGLSPAAFAKKQKAKRKKK